MTALRSLAIFLPVACICQVAVADDESRYIELSREIVACVELLNAELAKVDELKKGDELMPVFTRLAERYNRAAQELRKLDPPSSPAKIAELIPLQDKMKEEYQSFMQSRSTLLQSNRMSKKLEALLKNLVKKKQP